MKGFCVVMFLVLAQSNSFGSASDSLIRNFVIRVAGIKIGELRATKISMSDSSVRYQLNSRIQFWFFQKVEVTYFNDSLYERDTLTYSKVITTSNRGNFHAITQRTKQGYKITVRAYEYEKDTTLTEPIRFNVARLYFEKPVTNKIYADGYGLLLPPREVKPNELSIWVQGNRQRFLYHDQKVHTVYMSNKIKDYEIKADEN
jgi:hypothetical protein